MRSIATAVLFAASIFAVGLSDAEASTWRVGRDPTDCPEGCNFDDFTIDGGTDRGDGIKRAMQSPSVFPGDTVLVYPRPGLPPDQICSTDNSFFFFFTMKSGVILKAALGPNTVCIGGQANAEAGIAFVNASEATVVDAMNFEWNAGENGAGGGVSAYVSSGLLKNCIFQNCQSGVGAAVFQFLSDVRLENNLFVNNTAMTGGGVVALSSSDPVIVGNTFYHCTAPFGAPGAALYSSDSSPTFTKNVISDSEGAAAIFCVGSANGTVTCNLLWESAFGAFGGSCGDLTGTQNNINANPGFCDEGNLDFNMCSVSPGLTGPCGRLGYLPPTGSTCANCPTTVGFNLESVSWGRVKSLYR